MEPIPKNLGEIFWNLVEKHPQKIGFSYKEKGVWKKITYGEMGKGVKDFAMGLLSLGYQKGEKLAILSENRIEWAITDLAAISISVIDVPIYSTNPPSKIEYILADSEARGIVVSSQEQLEKVLLLQKKKNLLKEIIVMDPLAELPDTTARILSFQEVSQKGIREKDSYEEEFSKRLEAIQPSDLVTLIYTSGTTGEPKGVMMSHRNFVSNILSLAQILPDPEEDEVALSFLPLSHSFERNPGFYCMMYKGVQIAYSESIAKVPENLMEVRPTIMASVPRLYEKFYVKIQNALKNASWFRRKLFSWAFRTGKEYRDLPADKRGFWLALKFSLADRLVFSKIRSRLGGRIKYLASGGAPLSPEIMEFFYIAGLTILQGYGLTEAGPVLTANTPEDFKIGTVGKPVPGVEIQIAEDGEILARGPNIMEGYFKKEKETAEVITDGWLHTGDIGEFDPDGFLKITDRKKNILVTAGGKNIPPQYIENLLKQDPLFEEVVVVGDKRKYLSALIVPNFEALKAWANDQKISFSSNEELVQKDEVKSLFEERIETLSENLASYEKIKKFTLLSHPFSEEGGELTPTLKVRRKIIEEKYKKTIDSMYPKE